jgi:WD40 repeat protein
LQKLSGHRDYGFACDWADDGWTIATAFQDKTVKIWDARRFTDSAGNAAPVCTIRSEMAGARSLRFSPIGSGKRVLVAAEEADFINIIDAQTFRSKQTIDVFGELGGISFENGGQDLMVLCCDRARGGILQLERCNQGGDFMWNSDGEPITDDWRPSIFTKERHVSRRRRRAAAHADMDPF